MSGVSLQLPGRTGRVRAWRFQCPERGHSEADEAPGGGRRLTRGRAGTSLEGGRVVWSGLSLGGHGDWAREGEYGLVSLEAAPWHWLPR